MKRIINSTKINPIDWWKITLRMYIIIEGLTCLRVSMKKYGEIMMQMPWSSPYFTLFMPLYFWVKRTQKATWNSLWSSWKWPIHELSLGQESIQMAGQELKQKDGWSKEVLQDLWDSYCATSLDIRVQFFYQPKNY